MFKNYLKMAFRTIIKNKGFSTINILGLSIGLTCCILILLWVKDELSFDRFHAHFDELYRVEMLLDHPSGLIRMPITPSPLAAVLKSDYPEVKEVVRFTQGGDRQIKYGEKRFFSRVTAADPTIFNMFSFTLLKGNPEIVLSEKYAIVLTESTGKKYFAGEEPLGKILDLGKNSYKVTGILHDIPPNSHLQFDCLIPFNTAVNPSVQATEDWHEASYYTYVQLRENASYQEVSRQIAGLLKKHHTESKETLLLNPIARIHLHHDLMDYVEPAERPGNIKYVYIFSALAIFLLIIACINFMNLVTARSGYRAKEIALRKVVGAVKMDLIKQFLGESILLSVIALALAIGLVELLLPTFSALSGKPLAVNYTRDVGTILGLIGITLLTGIIAGSYPALVLSSFQPANVLKGSFKGSSKHSLFRKALVVFQFALTVFSIIATLVIYNQLRYVDTIDLGYDKENIVYIPLRSELRGKFDTIKNELLGNENVVAVTGGSMPIEAMTSTLRVDWDGKDPGEKIPMHGLFVDYDYVETLKMEITQGRNFSRKFSSDATSGFLINEEAAKAMAMKSPVGKRLFFFRREGQIVGVVKNFHYGSLHNKIGPTVFQIDPVIRPYVCVRIKPTGSSGTIHSLEKIWKTFDPDYPFRYHYLDETISNFYKSEQRMGKIFNYFTFLALFISCLGLFGLASFMTQRRTKEIGIRKIVGATVPGILLLLIKEYKKWVIIANVIAWPVAYYAMSKWMQNFAYRTGIEIWIFLLAALFSLILVPFTVGYYSVKAALTNPVNALRYE